MTATMEAVTIASRHLAAAVRSAGLVIPKRHHRAILRNARVTLHDGDGVGVYATDLSISVAVTIGDVNADAVADALLPPHVASAVAKAKGDATVAIHDGVIEAFGASIPGGDATEFPLMAPWLEGSPAARLPMRMFRLMDEHVSAACDQETSRYSLGGVLIERRPKIDPYSVHAIGTDGRRMHVASCRDDRSGGGELGVIVPVDAITTFRRAVGFMAASLAGKGGRAAETLANSAYADIRFAADDDHQRAIGDYGAGTLELRWRQDGVCVTVTARTFAGRFPRWRDCIPADAFAVSPVYCPMPETERQVRDAARVTTEQAKAVRLAGGRITARGHDGASFDAAFVGTGGDSVTVGLDPRFWVAALDGVAAVTSVPVRMHVVDGGKTAVTFSGNGGLTPDVGEIGFTAVVMPIAN